MTATDRLSDCCSQCSAVQGGGEAPVLGRPTIRLGELAHAGGGLRLCVLIGLLLLPRQDYTGVPAVLDFAVLLLGANPEASNPRCPSRLVIEFSVQVLLLCSVYWVKKVILKKMHCRKRGGVLTQILKFEVVALFVGSYGRDL